MTSISDLEIKIALANDSYSKGQPYLTDSEYDALWRELYDLDPGNPELYHTSRDPQSGPHTKNHPLKIMGTQKAFEIRDMKPFYQRLAHLPWILEPKYDGVAAMLYPPPPEHPHRYLAILEGDSLKGRDISHHLPYIDLPNHHGPRLSVELLIPWANWSPDWGANPRNVCAGWINSGSKPSEHPQVVQAIRHNAGPLYYDLQLPKEYTLGQLEELFIELYHEWSKLYPMDGIMIKLANQRDRLRISHNGSVSLWSIAWKPPIQVARTIVRQIHWNVSRQGKVVPKLEYDPVNLCGTTNRFVTANNYVWLYRMKCGPGAEISIGKAGEIIPKILEVHQEVEVPALECCPICDSYLHLEGVHLVCKSPNCIAQLIERIAYFYSVDCMNIKGIGSKMVANLLEDPDILPILAKSPWALLDPWNFGLISKMTSHWGEGATKIFLDSLDEANHNRNKAHFLAGLNYHKLGYKHALALLQEMKGHKRSGNVTKDALSNLPSALTDLHRAILELPNFNFMPLPDPPKLYYTITGSLSVTRNEMIDFLSSFGWEFTNTQTTKTSLLIQGKTDKVTKKIRDAKVQGAKIISEEELYNWIKDKEDSPNVSRSPTPREDQAHNRD